MTLLLAPMEGLLDFVLRDILTRVGGIDRCVSGFIRITDQFDIGAGSLSDLKEIGCKSACAVHISPLF
jgi:tRNA-dihydrouridine synthase